MVDQHCHRKRNAGFIRCVGLFLARVVLALEQNALGKELVKDFNHLVFIAAAVEAHVEQKCLCALREHLVDAGARLIEASGVKIVDFDIADIAV